MLRNSRLISTLCLRETLSTRVCYIRHREHLSVNIPLKETSLQNMASSRFYSMPLDVLFLSNISYMDDACLFAVYDDIIF